jgi:hypothetical protein
MSDFPEMEYKPIEEGEVIELAEGESSLHFFQKIYRSTRQPMQRRMRAAEYAIQHEHPKLGAIGYSNLNQNDFASLLEKAILRSNGAREVKQIEAQAIQVEDEAQANDDHLPHE